MCNCLCWCGWNTIHKNMFYENCYLWIMIFIILLLSQYVEPHRPDILCGLSHSMHGFVLAYILIHKYINSNYHRLCERHNHDKKPSTIIHMYVLYIYVFVYFQTFFYKFAFFFHRFSCCFSIAYTVSEHILSWFFFLSFFLISSFFNIFIFFLLLICC